MEDIDWDKVRKFINKVNEKNRFHLSGTPEEDLKKLKLIRDGKITNAAFLLFAKEDIPYNVHLGRFKTPSMIIDDRMLRLPLFEAVAETMKYIISQIKFAFEIKGMPTQRTEIPEYPLDALRELVLNAIIHRDYLSPTDIQIKIFDNHITFFNSGKLHDDLTIDDLKTNSYPAYARNKLIAEAFYLTGDIEKYGSGFLRIHDAIALYPTMNIDFKEIGGGFMVTVAYTKQKTNTSIFENLENEAENSDIAGNITGTMKKSREKTVEKGTEKTIEKTVEKTVEKVGENEKTVEKGTEKTIEETVEKTVKKVGENEKTVEKSAGKGTEKTVEKTIEKTVEKIDKIDKKILQLIENSIYIKVSEISKKIERGISVTNERIAKLKAKGLLERIGPDKGGYWKVIRK